MAWIPRLGRPGGSAYSLLPSASPSSPPPSSADHPLPRKASRLRGLVVAAAAVGSLVIAFQLGAYSASTASAATTAAATATNAAGEASRWWPAGTPQLATERRTFHYDGQYGPTDNSSAAAWEALLPAQGGFFRHPELSPAGEAAPGRVTFAVYHQLHCLDALRTAYGLVWETAAAEDGAAGARLREAELPLHVAPLHVRHCVDLLRQALMCRPDLTIEVVQDGGVTGFGTEHLCASWPALAAFVGDWESWRSDADAGKAPASHHDHHNHGHTTPA